MAEAKTNPIRIEVGEGESLEDIALEMCDRHDLSWERLSDGTVVFHGSRNSLLDFLEEF